MLMCVVRQPSITHSTSAWFPRLMKYYFPGQSIQDLKARYQDKCQKAYHIYLTYD